MFRGLTMLVMLLVDYTFHTYPELGHVPWDGIHLADFVMPFFLWVSGASFAMSLQARAGESRVAVLGQVILRALRLFALGLVVQGGLYKRESDVGVLQLNLLDVRICGILQRIAVCFVIVASIELFVPQLQGQDDMYLVEEPAASSAVTQAWRSSTLGFQVLLANGKKWLVVGLVISVGAALTHVKPPWSWPGCGKSLFMCAGDGMGGGACLRHNETTEFVEEQMPWMGCSGVGFMDSQMLGVQHLLIKGSDSRRWPPSWGFDPEGPTTTLSATAPMFVGLHVGDVVCKLRRDPRAVLHHVLPLGTTLAFVGLLLSQAVPLNKNLWSISYSCLTCGSASLVYAAFFAGVDAAVLRPSSFQACAWWLSRGLAPLQWVGCNGIFFFVFSSCGGGLDFLLRSVAWGYPQGQHNLVYWFQNRVLMGWLQLDAQCELDAAYEECRSAVMAFVWIEILFWILVCGLLFRKRLFCKI